MNYKYITGDFFYSLHLNWLFSTTCRTPLKKKKSCFFYLHKKNTSSVGKCCAMGKM